MTDNTEFVEAFALAMLIDAGKAIALDGVQLPGTNLHLEQQSALAWVRNQGEYAVTFETACLLASGCESLDVGVIRRRFLAFTDPVLARRLHAQKVRKTATRYRAEPVPLDDIPGAAWRRVYTPVNGVKVFARSSEQASDWSLWGCAYVF